MENAEFKIPKLKPLDQLCYIPSYTLFFDYLSDVLMCPHDWGKKIILGNLMQNSILDIWFSEKSLRIRKQLGGKIEIFSVQCLRCEWNVNGTKNSEYFT